MTRAPITGVPGVNRLTEGEINLGVPPFELVPQLDEGLGSTSFCQHLIKARHLLDNSGAVSTNLLRISFTTAPTLVT